MTMNMPPPYNQQPSYMQASTQPYMGFQSQSNPTPHFRTYQPNIPVNIPPNVNQSFSPNFPQQQYNANRSYSPLNVPPPTNHYQNIGGVPRQNVGAPFSNPDFNQTIYNQTARQNNFMRPSQVQPHYVSPNSHGVYAQQPYPQYPHYQGQNYANYQGPIPQNYLPYNQPFNQNYIPVYSSPTGLQNYQSLNASIYNQIGRNIPEQSINSNFNYQQANFDCNYSVEENLVHCVLCNQTYKTSQKKQHLELHRQKVRSVNIRPVDEEQLKRLQKYNAMIKKGLMIKPIVEPDEFNVQYNPNEFVLRKVTQYKDVDAPATRQIPIQTDQNPMSWSRPQDLGYSESRRSQGSSPERGNQSVRISQNPTVNPNRMTNTRFNADSVREEEQIFISQKFDNHPQGQQFKSNYNANQSLRESERRSQASQHLGYNNDSSSFRAREAESISRPQDLGYGNDSKLQSIREDREEERNSNQNQIPINKIVQQVYRDSQY